MRKTRQIYVKISSPELHTRLSNRDIRVLVLAVAVVVAAAAAVVVVAAAAAALVAVSFVVALVVVHKTVHCQSYYRNHEQIK
jgi:fatty acid desaturase